MRIQISLSGEIVPGGVYASVKANGSSVIRFKTMLNAVEHIDPSRKDIHCTVLYSRNKDNATGTTRSRNAYAASIRRFHWWPGHDKKGYFVALLDSFDLQEAFRDWQKLGYSFDFTTYDPHITIKTGITKEEARDAADLLTLEYFKDPFIITFGPQKVEPLRD